MSRTIWRLPEGCRRRGWVLSGHINLGDVTGACEACGTAIRYVHTLIHKEWPKPIETGYCCAEQLAEKYVDEMLEHERDRKNRQGRVSRERRTFLDPECWKPTQKGNFETQDERWV